MGSFKKFCFIISVIYLGACTEKNNDAQLYLDNIKVLYENRNYDTAIEKIDSLKILYPKAFDQIKESLVLLQEVRRMQNKATIANCDSLISYNEAKIDSIKSFFIFEKNKEYQEKGSYLPKGSISNNGITNTTLRSGVTEDGILFLESVYIGSQIHKSMQLSTANDNSITTLNVTDDGLNFRFTDSGKQYEVIRYQGQDENGAGRFIYAFADKAITATLKGQGKTSFKLSDAVKKQIANSYQLSVLLQEKDSLQNAKEKAEVLIRYLDSKTTKKDSL